MVVVFRVVSCAFRNRLPRVKQINFHLVYTFEAELRSHTLGARQDLEGLSFSQRSLSQSQ